MATFAFLTEWVSWPALVLASRIFGGLLFARAGWAKIQHFEEFVGLVARYKLVPFAMARLAAWLVVGCEAVVALSLLSGLFAPVGAIIAVAMLAFFALAMLVAWLRGERELDCGCFQSALRQYVSPALVLRNFVLIVLVLPALVAPGQLLLGHFIDGIGAGVTIFLLSQAFGELLAVKQARALSGKGAAQ